MSVWVSANALVIHRALSTVHLQAQKSVHKDSDIFEGFVGMSLRKAKKSHGQFLWVSEGTWEAESQTLGLHLWFYSSWDQRADRGLAPGVLSLSFLFNYSSSYHPQTVSSPSAFNCGKQWTTEWNPACLWVSAPLTPQPHFLLAVPVSSTWPIFSAPKPLGRCRIAFGLKCLSSDVSFSVGKSSLWSFQLFDYFFFIFLFITELSVRRQNSLWDFQASRKL